MQDAQGIGKGVLLDEGIGSGGGHTLRLAATCRSSFSPFFFTAYSVLCRGRNFMAPFHQLFTLLSGGEHVARPLQKDRRESREDSKEQERWRRRNDVRRFKFNLSCQRCLETPRFDGADAGLVATGWKPWYKAIDVEGALPMPLKVQTCLAQACVAPSGTNAIGQCNRAVRPMSYWSSSTAGIRWNSQVGHSVGPWHQQLDAGHRGDLARCSDLLGGCYSGRAPISQRLGLGG